ncbi:alpha/beta-hydrolase [Xylariomycetidae sp. FL2044]|nr:alpha/beta-hydrolase [Xylariomycetidae sp. FL2044]
MRSKFALPALLAGLGHASSDGNSGAQVLPLIHQQSYYPPTADCFEYLIPVTITSEDLVFNITKWKDDFALQDFLTSMTTRPSAMYPAPYDGTTATETATYNIAASFCMPKENAKKTVIIATHGIGQGRPQWNSPYEPESYNFVQYAIDKGYSVFFYDRLGCGDSSKVSGYTNQSRKQQQVLKEIATMIRAGQYTGGMGVPDKVVGMGFSFGSYITHYTVAAYPELFDAAVLTAINYNLDVLNGNGIFRSFVPRIASLQNPRRFGQLDTGYLTWVDEIAQINTYFKYPFYDIAVASLAEEMKQPFGIGEFLTITDGDLDASNFTGAALAIAGKQDYIICDGECEGIFEEPARTVFKNAKTFVPYLHPDSSHNMNFHFNATGEFGVITDFLDANL